uniref:type IV secretory system conjugative DNA transfer family protein n=1 Tax=Enterobacter roggenkampii TaxID=1812935 RepID=UPI001F15500A
RSHWSTSKTPSYTKSVSWQHHQKADEIFTANFNRLTRDYTGMLRYSTLLQQGMIKAPVITQQQQTVTGDKNRLMLGDKTKRMKQQAEFDINKRSWKPTIR